MSAVAMDYFRRPSLTGFNLARVQFASIYGSVRRHDADGTSAVPYFPAVTAGETLSIKLDNTTTYSVTLSGNTLSGIINDINAVLTTNGSAFDSDGCVGIQTDTFGSAGAVEVLGGNAAALLGFGPNGTGVRSVGGDLDSAPNAHVGNPFGTVFSAKKENLTGDSVNRALGRIAANTDVLYSEHVREDAIFKKLTGITVAGSGAYITLPVTARIYTGLGILSRTSAPEELAPFFQLIDSTTRQPTLSRVVGIVNGTPSGSPPFADSPNWADTTGKNILGLSLSKLSGVAITNILYGRYIITTGTTFTSTVVAGDYLQISSATNTDQWNNNGLKWVINAVLDDTTLDVRPMSQSELSLVGTSVLDAQPVVELNSSLSGVESFGTISVFSGSYAQLNASATPTLNVVVSPPIPSGQTVELWMAQPDTIRKEIPYDLLESAAPEVRTLASAFYTVPNALISGAAQSDPSSVGTTIQIAASAFRINGKYVSVPQLSVATSGLSGFSGGTKYYFYYDPVAGAILNHAGGLPSSKTPVDSVSLPGYNGSQTAIIPICIAQTGGMSQPVVFTNLCQFDALGVRTLTVGNGASFPTLESAAAYVSAWAASFSETTDTSGAYPHWEIVLISNVSVTPGKVLFAAPSVRITGITPKVKLTFTSTDNTTPNIHLLECSAFQMENLSITETGQNDGIFIQVDSAGSTTTDLLLRNVRHDSTSSFGFQYIAQTVNSGKTGRVLMEDDSFQFYRGILGVTTSTTGRVVMSTSRSTQISGYATPTLFAGQAAAAWGVAFLTVQASKFLSGLPTDSTPYLFTSSTATKIVFRGNQFTFGSLTAGINSVLAVSTSSTATLHFSENDVGSSTNPIHRCLDFTNSINDVIASNTIFIKPESNSMAGNIGINCTNALLNKVTLVNPDGGYVNQVCMQVSQVANGNFITGKATNGLIHDPVANGGGSVTDNIIQVVSYATSNGINVNGGAFSFSQVTGNFVTAGANSLLFSGPTTFGTVTGNVLQNNGGSVNYVLNAPGATSLFIVSGNILGGNFISAGTFTNNYIAANDGPSTVVNGTFSGNYFTNGSGGTLTLTNCTGSGNTVNLENGVQLIASGCEFSGNLFTDNTASGVADSFTNCYLTGNSFVNTGGGGASTLSLSGGTAVGNSFNASRNILFNDVELNGNKVTGSLQGQAGTSATLCNNNISGSVTVSAGLSWASMTISGNIIGGAITSGVVGSQSITGNTITGAVTLNGTGSPISVFSSNRVGGTFFSAQGGANAAVNISDCYFVGNVSSTDANQELNTSFIGGTFFLAAANAINVSGVTVIGGTVGTPAPSNSIAAGVTANVSGCNFSSPLTVDSSLCTSYTVTGNTIIVSNPSLSYPGNSPLHITGTSTANVGLGEISGNFIFLTNNNNAGSVQNAILLGNGGSTVYSTIISGNTILCYGTPATAGTGFEPIKSAGTVYQATISGNHIVKVTASLTTVVCIRFASVSGAVVVSGNMMSDAATGTPVILSTTAGNVECGGNNVYTGSAVIG